MGLADGSDGVNLPPNIENYSRIVAELQHRDHLSGDQKKKLAICKLRIALWACKSEGMPVTRYSLSEILGPDTSFVLHHAQSILTEIPWESAEDRAAVNAMLRAQGGKSAPAKKGKVDLGTYH